MFSRVWVSEAENFTKMSHQKRCEKRRISCKFHSAGAWRWQNLNISFKANPDPPFPAFLAKNKDPPKKARIFRSAEPPKSLEKRAKTHKNARKTAKRKKQGNLKKQGLDDQGRYPQKTLRVHNWIFLDRRALWDNLKLCCGHRQLSC